jgi:hypothetical protein
MTMLVQPVSGSSKWSEINGSSDPPLMSVVVPVYKEARNVRSSSEPCRFSKASGITRSSSALIPRPTVAEIERNPSIGLLVFAVDSVNPTRPRPTFFNGASSMSTCTTRLS